MPPIPPPPPLPPARFSQKTPQAVKPAPTLDVFEPSQDKTGQLVIHIRSLEEENTRLKARVQELESKSSSRHHRHHHHHRHRHTSEHLEKKRASVLEELALVREALLANQVKYEELILVADNPELIANLAREMGKSVLLAKMALQKQANDFERETLRQNRTRYNELLHQLGPLALKLAPHTNAQLTHNTLVANAAQALQMDADIGPLKEALSPTHYNKERAYAILEVKLLKFLETQKPRTLCAEEWELYLCTREQSPSRDILKRYGIQFKALLTDLMVEVERRPGFRAESLPGLKMLQL